MVGVTQLGPWGIPVGVFVGPVVLHTYGLILGVAGLFAWHTIHRAASRVGVPESELRSYLWCALAGGVIGARVWHVVTDWHLYVQDWVAIFFIWRGGLSILGGVVGAGLAVAVARRLSSKQSSNVARLFDSAVLGLPIAQAVGRLGNFVNQELYGLPTSLWWGLPIAETKRVADYVAFTHFHPLFAYEAIPMLVFAAVSWNLVRRGSVRIGSGVLTGAYLFYYALLRLLLDFLRIDAARVWWGMTLNQLVLATLLLAFGLYGVVKQFARMNK